MIILVNYRNIGLHFSIFDQCVERIFFFSAVVVPRMQTKRNATHHYRVSVLDSTYEINITVNRKRFRFHLVY